MKEINFNFALKGLDGKEIPESNAGKILSSALANDSGKNPVKVWAWAQLFYGGQTLQCDPSDLEFLKGLIETSPYLPAMTKAQLLEVINK
jgi:hypothetical protein